MNAPAPVTPIPTWLQSPRPRRILTVMLVVLTYGLLLMAQSEIVRPFVYVGF